MNTHSIKSVNGWALAGSSLCAISLLLSGCAKAPEIDAPEAEVSVPANTTETPVTVSTPASEGPLVAPDSPAKQYTADDLRGLAHDGNLEGVAAAVASGLAAGAADREGRTALMLAAFNGHSDSVSFLLDKGAEIDHADSIGRTALLYAASGPFPETVKLLIARGADVKTRDKQEGWTALMFASGEGHAETVKILLEAGADKMLKDVDGDFAIDHARSKNHAAVVKLLQ